MQPMGGIKTKAHAMLGMSSRQTWTQLAIIFGLTILYIVTFQPLWDRIGSVGAALIAIPVALAGWYFGINAGLFASFIGIVLSTLLLMKTNDDNWITWIVIGWPGDLMVTLVGYFSGRIHKELAERTRIEAELRSRDRYLTLLKMATSNILNPKNPGDRYYYLITHLVNLFVADYGYFFRWDARLEQAIHLTI